MITFQILNWNGLENVWSYVRNICTTQFGDTSFNSFVKMLIAKNHQVNYPFEEHSWMILSHFKLWKLWLIDLKISQILWHDCFLHRCSTTSFAPVGLKAKPAAWMCTGPHYQTGDHNMVKSFGYTFTFFGQLALKSATANCTARKSNTLACIPWW